MPGGGIVPKTISESEPISEVKKITEPVSIGFAGAVYENENEATTDDPRRFETSSRKLRDLIIQVSGNDQLFGNAANQRYNIRSRGIMGSHSKVAGLPDLTDEKIWVGNSSNRPVEEDKPEAGDMGLSYYGKVTTFTDTTHFKASVLAGFGNDFFKGYFVYVVRDAGGAGAAPQFEQVEVLDYTSLDGTFEHDAFSTPLAVDDEILIVLLPVAIGNMKVSDYPIAVAPTERTAPGTTYVKLKEVRISRAGYYRLKWEFKGSTATTPGAYTRYYVNDSPVGMEHENQTTNYEWVEEDTGLLSHGDLVQLYATHKKGVAYNASVRNFKVCGEAFPSIGKVTQD